MRFDSLGATTRVWLTPTGFLAAPQMAGEGESARLAGTMIWFTQIALLARDDSGNAVRVLVPLSELSEKIARLPGPASAAAATQYARLIAPRLPLNIAGRSIPLDQPRIMGILNLTPDSFSDGGRFQGDDGAQLAAEAAAAMAEQGAAIVDVGGESTRPGAPLVWEGDEIARVVPVIERLARAGVAVSIDSRKAAVMEAALAAGAGLINDISALLYDDRSVEIVAEAKVPVVLMHAASQGSDPHKGPAHQDVVTEVFDWLEHRVDKVVSLGVDRSRIVVDPGVGFGKTLAENLALMNALPLFHALGCPLLLGASRKRLIGALSNEAPVEARLGGSIALAMKGYEAGCQLVRVHDVAESVQAARVWRGLRDSALTMRTRA